MTLYGDSRRNLDAFRFYGFNARGKNFTARPSGRVDPPTGRVVSNKTLRRVYAPRGGMCKLNEPTCNFVESRCWESRKKSVIRARGRVYRQSD